jgi:hypothetical protein
MCCTARSSTTFYDQISRGWDVRNVTDMYGLDAVLAAGRARSGAPTGEFYALSVDEARDLRADGYSDPHTLDSVPVRNR